MEPTHSEATPATPATTSRNPTAQTVKALHGDERLYFRWRGVEVSRLENFSDVVFAFALTLLVVSTEVPRSFPALLAVLRGFPAFACSFLLLVAMWHNHYLYFRRYGLHDTTTTALNNILLLLVLFCVYPLKFLFSVLNDTFSPWADAQFFTPAALATLRGVNLAVLLRIYAGSLGSIFLLFALLYGRAWKLRKPLELNRAERLATLRMMSGFGLTMLVCGLSALLTMSPAAIGWAGLLYAFLIPVLILNASYFRRRIKRAADAL